MKKKRSIRLPDNIECYAVVPPEWENKIKGIHPEHKSCSSAVVELSENLEYLRWEADQPGTKIYKVELIITEDVTIEDEEEN